LRGLIFSLGVANSDRFYGSTLFKAAVEQIIQTGEDEENFLDA
jgi:hypothetical protein